MTCVKEEFNKIFQLYIREHLSTFVILLKFQTLWNLPQTHVTWIDIEINNITLFVSKANVSELCPVLNYHSDKIVSVYISTITCNMVY
jgi:hypothetical protein